jgi:hypothetical protein
VVPELAPDGDGWQLHGRGRRSSERQALRLSGASRGQSVFPQARVLGLVESGTHAVVAASIASYGHSEVAMAAEFLPTKLTGDMLVMADRNFYSSKPWHEASASGAGLLWRAKSNLGLPVQHELADGSYLSTVFDIDDKRRQNGREVQVIDCTREDPAAPVQGSYRLVTNLLDPGGGTGAGVGGAVPRALGD